MVSAQQINSDYAVCPKKNIKVSKYSMCLFTEHASVDATNNTFNIGQFYEY